MVPLRARGRGSIWGLRPNRAHLRPAGRRSRLAPRHCSGIVPRSRQGSRERVSLASDRGSCWTWRQDSNRPCGPHSQERPRDGLPPSSRFHGRFTGQLVARSAAWPTFRHRLYCERVLQRRTVMGQILHKLGRLRSELARRDLPLPDRATNVVEMTLKAVHLWPKVLVGRELFYELRSPPPE